eukprot:UC4_evm4s1138
MADVRLYQLETLDASLLKLEHSFAGFSTGPPHDELFKEQRLSSFTSIVLLQLRSSLINANAILMNEDLSNTNFVNSLSSSRIVAVKEDRVTIRILGCIEKFFSQIETFRLSEPKNPDLFEIIDKLMGTISLLLDYRAMRRKSIFSSEEARFCAIRCLGKMWESGIVGPHDKTNTMAVVGHCIFVLLDNSIPEERDCPEICRDTPKSLRYEAIKTISVVIQSSRAVELAPFLPGIVSSMTKIITGDYRRGHTVVGAALDCWGSIVALVMSDSERIVCLEEQNIYHNPRQNALDELRKIIDSKDSKESHPKNGNTESNHKTILDFSDRTLKVDRSDYRWWQINAEQLCLHVSKIVGRTASSSWQIRLKLANWAGKILRKCVGSIPNAAPDLIEILIVLSEDYHVEVSKPTSALILEAADIFQVFLHNCTTSNYSNSAVIKRVWSLLASLPKSLQSFDADTKIRGLMLLSGYIRIIGKHVSKAFRILMHRRRLASALITCLDFDDSNTGLITLCADKSLSSIFSTHQPFPSPPLQKHNEFAPRPEIAERAHVVCKLLGRYGDLLSLLDLFLSRIMPGSNCSSAALTVVQDLLVGCSLSDSNDKNILNTAVRLTVSRFRELWQNGSFWEESIGKESLSKPNNIVSQCMVLETLASIAKITEENFAIHLSEVSYYVLAQVSSHVALVRDTALYCLDHICHACNYPTISELVRRNCDYLIEEIYYSLDTMNTTGLAVLRSIVGCGEHDIFPYIADSITEIISLLDLTPHNFPEAIISVLHEFVLASKRWGHVAQYSTIIEKGYENPRNEIHVLTCKILNRCSHFAHVSSRHTRLMSIRVAQDAIISLKYVEDDLLPAAHELWSTVLRCVADDWPPVVLQTLELTSTLTDICGDFLMSRINEKLLPIIFLRLQKLSVSTPKRKTDKFNKDARLCRCLLKFVKRYGDNIELKDEDLDRVIDAIMPYLSCDEDEETKVLAKDALAILAKKNGDAVWFAVHYNINVPSSQKSSPFVNIDFPKCRKSPCKIVLELINYLKKN